MTEKERWNFYENGDFRQTVAIKLLDWAGYWARTGLDEIESPLQKEQTRRAINMIVQDLSYVLRIVVSLVISDDTIKVTSVEDITPEMINTAMVSVMANCLEWVTDVTEVPGE